MYTKDDPFIYFLYLVLYKKYIELPTLQIPIVLHINVGQEIVYE